MNELQIFNHPDFGQVRTVTINDEPWFVGKDVADVLGYEAPKNAIPSHVDEDDRFLLNAETQHCFNAEFSYKALGQRGGWLINESGLYSLILSSKLPGAKEFKHWVTSEVLPSIRKHGGYIAGQEDMPEDELLAKAILVANRKIEERDNRINELTEQVGEMEPKALFADSVAASSSTVLVGELAKILRQNGVDMGEKRLFNWMRENGYLIKRNGTDYNMPTQRSMDMGLFRIKETVVTHGDGHTTVTKTPKVTGKGQQYFINLFVKKKTE